MLTGSIPPVTAWAQTPTPTPAPGTGTGSTGGAAQNMFYIQNPLNPRFNSVGGLINGFLEIFSYLVILFAVLMLIWVGLQFVLAQGKPDRMKELKNWLLWIVVGVAIVIGARIIVAVVINTLQATGVVNQGVIQNANNALRANP